MEFWVERQILKCHGPSNALCLECLEIIFHVNLIVWSGDSSIVVV